MRPADGARAGPDGGPVGAGGKVQSQMPQAGRGELTIASRIDGPSERQPLVLAIGLIAILASANPLAHSYAGLYDWAVHHRLTGCHRPLRRPRRC